MKTTALINVGVLLIAAIALAACTEQNGVEMVQNGGAAEAKGVSSRFDRAAPEAKKKKPTLTVATSDNNFASKSYSDNLPVWQEVEKKTGIQINWDVTLNSQYSETMNMRIATGKKLPDIFLIPDVDPVTSAVNGLIVPLDDLIAEHAPHISKFLKENPEIDKKLRLADGRIYSIASVVTGVSYTDPYGILIRKDWLDKLGLREPTTLQEWYTVLKAFKEKDPNGNGIHDEIPLLPNLGLRGLLLFGSAGGGHFFYSQGFYPDAKGNVRYEWASDEMKEYVEWLNKLYREGLIDQDFLTNTEEARLSAIGRGRVGVTNGFLNISAKYDAALSRSGDEDGVWVMTVPPGAQGRKGFYEIYGPVSGWYGISKDCKNPELAIQWLDFIYASEEGNRLVNFGIEGISYTMVGGKPKFIENAYRNAGGLDLSSFLRSLGAMPTLPWIRSEKGPLSLQPKAFMEVDPKGAMLADKVKPYLIESIPLALPTPEEKETDA